MRGMSTNSETLNVTPPASTPTQVEITAQVTPQMDGAEQTPQTAMHRKGPLTWLLALIPLALLAAMLAIFALGNPLAVFSADIPPTETLSFQRVTVTEDGFRFDVVNGGPAEVRIAQATVDAAFWNFAIEPSAVIPRLGTATITMQYPWVEGEPHAITLLTSTGATFTGE